MSDAPQIWKITELTNRIKKMLEGEFPSLWVEGEISSYRTPGPSGHVYFDLKDAGSVLPCVMFKGVAQSIKFPLKSGIQVRALGAVTVYPPHGRYQFQIKTLQLAGEGDRMLQLDALKKKLAAEGLFSADRKRSLPVLPQHIGIITSESGAVIHDMLKVLNRRFANIHILLAPVRVQGDGAAEDVASALDELNRRGGLDVLIVARGGGSTEDLWAFNEEVVVRAIARSKIPVISAIGHEVDYTLADFVADVRAPTPSAAAEILIKEKSEWVQIFAAFERRFAAQVHAMVTGCRNRIERAARTPGLRDPMQGVLQAQQTLDYISVRLHHTLAGLPPLLRQRTLAAARLIQQTSLTCFENRRTALQHADSKLRMLSPKHVLARGYSLTRTASGTIVRTPNDAPPGTTLQTEVANGTISSIVTAAERTP